ncbi:hypothetical protein FNF27_02435 [Cafeteria roenbergensis]|uniref:protein-tyrosine-phosphatase n=1 Tax=Cafeteria roenbergensis TaxID=33653 RepID=A0A5A8EDS7_CAFRO|nr:hypothetical protein FNF27_02435 [Cafeteria roenbergensis]
MAAGFTVSSRVATWKNGHARPDVLQTLSEARGVAAVRKVVVAGASLAALVIPRPEVPEGVGGDSPPRPLRAGWSIEVVTTLDLSNNSLRWLPDELFTALPALAALNLSHNRLQCIPSSFWLCTSLRRLELQCGEREAAPERALVGVGRASTHSAIPERATSRNATRGPSSAAQVRMSGGATSTCLRFFPPPLPEELLDEGGGDPHPDSVGWGVAGSPSAGSHKSVAMGAAAAAVAAAASVVTTTPAVPQGRGQAAPIGAGHSGASAVSPRASLGRATTPFGLVPAPVTEAGHPVTAAAPGAFHGLHGRPTDSVPAAPATPGRAVVDGSGAKAGTERGPADAARSPRRAGQTGPDSHPGGGDGGGDAGAGGLGSRARADSAVAPAAVAVSATATAIATDADGEGFRAALVHVSAADAAGLDVDAGPSALVSLPLAASSSGRPSRSAGFALGWNAHSRALSAASSSQTHAQSLQQRGGHISGGSHAGSYAGSYAGSHAGSAAGSRLLPNLAHVDLTGCGVEVLLPTVSELSALVRLRLNRNQLRSLPAELADLPALTIVDVEDNPLTRVPAAVKAKRGVQLVTGVPDQILPGLYLGDARAARNVEALRARQIHRVVMVSCELRPQLGAGLDTVVIPIKDAPSESLAFSRCPDPYFFRSVHRLRAVGRRVLVGLGEHGDTGSDGGESAFSTPEAGAMEGATTPHFAPEEADLPLSAASIAAPILGVGGIELFGGDGAPGVLPEPADGARASAGDSWASVDGSRAESSLGDGRDGQATGAPRARAPPLPAPFPVPVFVHCQAGASRSATIVIALVMRVTGWSLRRSFAHVRARRAVVSPNFGFFAQLQRFEKTLYEHGLLHLDDDDKAGLGPGEDPAACLPTLSVTGLVAATSGCINPNVWEARYGSGTAGSGSQAKGGIGSKLSGKSTGGIAGRRGAGPRRVMARGSTTPIRPSSLSIATTIPPALRPPSPASSGSGAGDLAEPDEDPEAERHGAFWYASGASAEGPSTRRRQMRRNSVTGF